jgi:two-component system response regulator PilR (NtrC family)
MKYRLTPVETNSLLATLSAAGQDLLRPHVSSERVLDCAQLDLEQPPLNEIIGRCDSILRLKLYIHRVAPLLCIVLIRGESGTGKERVARCIHELSPRRSRPLITVNCGAISENLLESELFGHLKGAFTGAYAAKKGYFEEADGSSIFLDEVAEIPLSAQVKLLRVLQENRFLPVGATSERQTDVRIIAATNRDLEADLRPEYP